MWSNGNVLAELPGQRRKRMKISVLNENTAGKRGFLAEHGLSLLIEHGGKRFLFDAGQTGVFLTTLKSSERISHSWTGLY